MKNKNVLFVYQSIFGAVLMLIGKFIFTSENNRMPAGLCYGFGAAMLVLGIGYLIKYIIVSNVEDEKIKKLKEIEIKDERNVRIKEKAGYMTTKIMNYVLYMFVLILGFMKVDNYILIMAAGLIVIEISLVIYFSNYFSKKM